MSRQLHAGDNIEITQDNKVLQQIIRIVDNISGERLYEPCENTAVRGVHNDMNSYCESG